MISPAQMLIGESMHNFRGQLDLIRILILIGKSKCLTPFKMMSMLYLKDPLGLPMIQKDHYKTVVCKTIHGYFNPDKIRVDNFRDDCNAAVKEAEKD